MLQEGRSKDFMEVVAGEDEVGEGVLLPEVVADEESLLKPGPMLDSAWVMFSGDIMGVVNGER